MCGSTEQLDRRKCLLLMLLKLCAHLCIHAPNVFANGVVQVRGAGATLPNDVFKVWMAAYKTLRSPHVDLEMTYDAQGSGNGKARIKSEKSDVEYAGSESLLSDQDYTNNPELQMFPAMAGALAIAFNIPTVTSLTLTREQIVGIYNGTYSRWNHTTFRLSNPGLILPDAKINVCARADKSGSTEIFTRTLSTISPEWNLAFGIFTGGEDENGNQNKWNRTAVKFYGKRLWGLADTIKSTAYSVGYISVYQAEYSRLSYASIVNRAGNSISPSLESVQSAMDAVSDKMSSEMTYHLVDTESDNAYPFASYTYIIIRKYTTDNCDSFVELIRYIDWFLFDRNAKIGCLQSKMVPISTTVVTKILDSVLKSVKCNNRNVYDLMLDQKEAEVEASKTWKTPVMVAVPLIVVCISLLASYLVYQRKRLNKILDKDGWELPLHELLFYSPSSMQFSKVKMGTWYKTASSVNTFDSLGGHEEIAVSGLLHWPGVWNKQNVGLRIHEIKDMDIDKSMRRLVQGLQNIIHENVLRFHGLISMDRARYIISDYPSKGSLRDILHDSSYNLNDSFKFSLGFDIAQGMSFLHQSGITHGHFRSACCVLNSKWTVKVTDWELDSLYSKMGYSFAKRRDMITEARDLHDNGDRVAMLNFWVAPELIRSSWKTLPNYKSDVYSFAIILQEIFSREDPYFEIADNFSKSEIVNAIVQNNLRPLPDECTPVGVKQAMEIAWADDQNRRPSFDQLLKMLKSANPSKKSVLDNMMEAMEEYTHHLEERIAELSQQLDLSKHNMSDVSRTFVPASMSKKLDRGESVNPELIDVVTLLSIRFENLHNLCASWSPAETIKVVNEISSLIDHELSHHGNVFKLDNCVNENMFISGNIDRSRLKHAGFMATFALSLLNSLKDITSLRKDKTHCITLQCGMHTGPVSAGIIGLRIPRYSVFGETVRTAVILRSFAEPNKILVSETCRQLLENIGGFSMKTNSGIPLWNGKSTTSFWLYGRLGMPGLPEVSLTSISE